MSEKVFIKLHSIYLEQVNRSMDHRFRNDFLLVFNEVIKRMNDSNMVHVTIKDLVKWGLREFLSKRVRGELERVGFWVSYKRSKYMINPRILNKAPTDNLPRLIGTYNNYQGKDVLFDSYVKMRKDYKQNMESNKMIEIEIKKIYEDSVSDKIREENKMNMNLINSLTKQLDVKDKQIEILLKHLSPEDKKNVMPQIRLVKNEK